MSSPPDRKLDVVQARPPLLRTESAAEFASLCDELEREIKPDGAIEQIYVQDVAELVWETLRYRRFKAVIINSATLLARRGLLGQLLSPEDMKYPGDETEADKLAHGWFKDAQAKTQVANLLRKFGLDEAAIEAEAFRVRAEDLDRLDRMLMGVELRRDRALRSITEHRHNLSKLLKQSSDRLIETDDVPQLVVSRKRAG